MLFGDQKVLWYHVWCHAIWGPERLEDSDTAFLFGFQWQDRFRVSAILGAHLVSIGIAALGLYCKAVFIGGLYDTWASGGGDIRLLKEASVTLNSSVKRLAGKLTDLYS